MVGESPHRVKAASPVCRVVYFGGGIGVGFEPYFAEVGRGGALRPLPFLYPTETV